MFQYENEAKQVYETLVERLAKFGLDMEREKTKILPFGRFKGINGMLQELYKIYFHTIYALRSSIFRRSQRRLSIKTFSKILERTPIVKPKIYKDIWCFNV